jgi:hypothetical protein
MFDFSEDENNALTLGQKEKCDVLKLQFKFFLLKE